MIDKNNLDWGNVLSVTVFHGDRKLRDKFYAITKAVAKTIKRGQPVMRDLLADRPSVKQLIRDAKYCHTHSGGEVWWKGEYEHEARLIVATRILEDAAEIINNKEI